MLYRNDPKTGTRLSALGLGCMRFSRGITGRIDLDRAESLLKAAVDAGVNYLDTAYTYPGSEAALGQIFRRNPGMRERVCLATKLPFTQCRSQEDFDRIFHLQLGRLCTDRIDYYLFHNLTALADWQRLVSMGIEEWIAQKQEAGQIRRLGFSSHGSQAEFIRLLNAHGWDFTQIQYNYADENFQAGCAGLRQAHAMGLPVIVMEPLLGGKLADGLPQQAQKILRKAVPDRSPAAWALRWLWEQPEVTVVLSGMNSIEQLHENCTAADESATGSLSRDERQALEQVAEAFRKSFKIPCTGCNYCMPCPKGVNIPGCFAAYNNSFAVGRITGFQQYFTSTNVISSRTGHSPFQCIQCGQCEKRCPQNIPIMSRLGNVRRRFEPGAVHSALKLARKIM